MLGSDEVLTHYDNVLLVDVSSFTSRLWTIGVAKPGPARATRLCALAS